MPSAAAANEPRQVSPNQRLTAKCPCEIPWARDGAGDDRISPSQIVKEVARVSFVSCHHQHAAECNLRVLGIEPIYLARYFTGARQW